MTMDNQNRWSKAKNILCIRLDSFGDVLTTAPALRALTESNTNRQLTLLTSPDAANAIYLIPNLASALVYKAPWIKAINPSVSKSLDFEMVSVLKACCFDACVIFTGFRQSPLPAAMLAYLANIPLRLAHCRGNPSYLLTDWLADTTDDIQSSDIRRQLDLVAVVGSRTMDERILLKISPQELEAVHNILAKIACIQPVYS